MSKKWNKFEELQLRLAYSCLGPTELTKLGWIPTRTKKAIERRASRLGLTSARENRVIDNDDGTSVLILDGRVGSERGRVLVDTDVVDQLTSVGKWSLLTGRGQLQYAYRKRDGSSILMHRFLLEEIWEQEIPEGYHVDHVNGNGLDNRRENLRAIPAGLNVSRDKGPRAGSKYDLPRGVTKGYQRKDGTQTYKMIHVSNKQRLERLERTFTCPRSAHLAYRLARFIRTQGDVYGDAEFIDGWGKEEWQLIRDAYTGKLPD